MTSAIRSYAGKCCAIYHPANARRFSALQSYQAKPADAVQPVPRIAMITGITMIPISTAAINMRIKIAYRAQAT
jgi:hypothetical protein